jgi:2,4-dienoyl-CoA reductase-like NADH-dependent reductase (Old Yellow Enzyme family)
MKPDSNGLRILSKASLNEELSYAIRGIAIPSRFFLAPINTGFFQRGRPTLGLLKFHLARSGKSIGISYVGNVAVSASYANTANTAFLSESLAWATVASAISSNGSLPGIQLACKTLFSTPSRKWVNKAPHEFIELASEHITSLPNSLIYDVIDQFVGAAKLSWDFGFRAVQIHAAHGYFLSLLLCKTINTRSDEFGNGIYAIQLIVERIRSLGLPLIVDIRVSHGFGRDTIQTESTLSLYRQLSKLDLDIISISNGYYEIDRFAIYPKQTQGHGVYYSLAAGLAKDMPELLWNVAGNIWDIKPLLQTIPTNLTLSIGRALIADPSFVEKAREKRLDTICQCERTGHCHYYSRNRNHIECGRNPEVAGDGSFMNEIDYRDTQH